jgi:hypothetical protein
MTAPETTTSPPTLESVLLDAWNMFHPGQPAPLGWLPIPPPRSTLTCTTADRVLSALDLPALPLPFMKRW